MPERRIGFEYPDEKGFGTIDQITQNLFLEFATLMHKKFDSFLR